MASFKDDKGRSWRVNITATTVRRVKDLTGVYLPTLVEDQFRGIDSLAQDVIQFIDVLYAVVLPDAEKDGVAVEQFGDALGGDSIERAAQALTNGIVDFFPEDRRRVLRSFLEKAKTVRTILQAKGEKELESLDPEKIVSDLLARQNPSANKSSDLSGSVPESSDSIQDRLASENS